MNEKQLMLYFGIGRYISANSRKGFWGKGAIDAISGQLQREMPGLRGFSARNLRYMRTFYEEWSVLDATQVTDGRPILADASAEKGDNDSNLAPASAKSSGTCNLAVAIAVIPLKPIWHLQVPNCAEFPADEFLRIGFTQHRTIFEGVKYLVTRCFYIRRCAEQKYTVEERKPHENPSIGIILCKDMNKSFVYYVIRDYSKPMGVATYKTADDMPENLRKALPLVEDLRRVLDVDAGNDTTA